MASTIKVSESAFQQQVESLARMYNYRTYHTWNSMHSTAGFPDLVMVKDDRLIFAELKSNKGKLGASQNEWLNDLRKLSPKGIEVYVWRPIDFDDVVRCLSGRDRTQVNVISNPSSHGS